MYILELVFILLYFSTEFESVLFFFRVLFYTSTLSHLIVSTGSHRQAEEMSHVVSKCQEEDE